MTMQGASEESSSDQMAVHAAADGHGADYRQDDAPPGASTAPESGPLAATPLPEPTRSVADIVTTLASTPHEFERLIQGKSDEALAQPATDGEWGVVEILPHLRDWEEVYLEWFQQVLAEEAPRLVVIDDSLWAIEHDYASENVPSVLERFADLRHDVVSLLEALDDHAWQRQAIHPQLGRITLHQLAERMCDHDARHIDQARDALA